MRRETQQVEILLIEDEDLVRQTLRLTLEQAEYVVKDAANGVEAERSLRDWDPDLVITDILMPEREGIEVIRDLAERFPALPILAISGGGTARRMEFLEIAGRLGAWSTLAKPFGRSRLLKEVEALLQRRRDHLRAVS